MRKFIRFIGILLLLIVVAVLVLGLIEPKDITVQRSMVINAPKDVIYDQVAKYSNWKHWSPFYMMDTTTKMTFTGVDGQPGNSYHWESAKTGEGEMTNTGVKDNELDYKLVVIKPAMATITGKESDGFFKFEDAGNNQTKVTWSYHKHTAYPLNFMYAMFDMDKMLGGTFDDGLKNIKNYLQEHSSGEAVNVQEIQLPTHIYAGARKTISTTNMAEMMKFFADTYGILGKAVMPNGPAVGLYYTWDTVNHVTDMAAAVPVADTGKPIAGIKFFTVASSKAYMTTVKGSYSQLPAAHAALMKHVAVAGKKASLEIEEYLKGPKDEKDSSKWETNIYYLVQ